MRLYFDNKMWGNYTLLVETNQDEVIFRTIEKYCLEHGLGLIYMIHHIEKNKIIYDVGRDDCFFVVEI